MFEINHKTISRSVYLSASTQKENLSVSTAQNFLTSSYITSREPYYKTIGFGSQSQIFSIYQNKVINNYFIELRGLNQDLLDYKSLLCHKKLVPFLTTLKELDKMHLILEIFNHMKKWLYIYGLIPFSQCLFRFKNSNSNSYSISQNQAAQSQNKILILYLGKRQINPMIYLSVVEKEMKFLRQFLIMFEKLIFPAQKFKINRIQEFQTLFIEKIHLIEKINSVSDSQMHFNNFSIKNSCITGKSIVENGQCLKLCKHKNIDKSMMIVQENSSQYSTPKKWITSSGFYDLTPHRKQKVLRVAQCQNKNPFLELNNKGFNKQLQEQINFIQPSLTQKKLNGLQIQHSPQRKVSIKFNYISPQKNEHRLRAVSNFEINNNNSYKHNIVKKRSLIQQGKKQKTQQVKIKAYIKYDQVSFYRGSSPVDKKFKNLQNGENMKHTATTLNSFQTHSSTYISNISLNQNSLRNSVSQQIFSKIHKDSLSLGSKNPNNQNKQAIQNGRQRKFSNFEVISNQNHLKYLNKPQSIESLILTSHNLFQPQDILKSNTKINNIPEQSKDLGQRQNQFQINDIEIQLQNLFSQSSQNLTQMENIIEEFEDFLFD